MTQAPLWVAVALVAVLVGVTVPVLLQLRRTLTSADQTLDNLDRRLGHALDEVSKTLGYVNRSAEEVERVTKRLGGLFQTMERTGSLLQRARSSLRTVTAIGASVGPMLVAAIRGALSGPGNGQYERHHLPVTKEISR